MMNLGRRGALPKRTEVKKPWGKWRLDTVYRRNWRVGNPPQDAILPHEGGV
jgi:hypothetical protein